MDALVSEVFSTTNKTSVEEKFVVKYPRLRHNQSFLSCAGYGLALRCGNLRMQYRIQNGFCGAAKVVFVGGNGSRVGMVG